MMSQSFIEFKNVNNWKGKKTNATNKSTPTIEATIENLKIIPSNLHETNQEKPFRFSILATN